MNYNPLFPAKFSGRAGLITRPIFYPLKIRTMKKLLDFIFGVPDQIIYNQLLADRLKQILDDHNNKKNETV